DAVPSECPAGLGGRPLPTREPADRRRALRRQDRRRRPRLEPGRFLARLADRCDRPLRSPGRVRRRALHATERGGVEVIARPLAVSTLSMLVAVVLAGPATGASNRIAVTVDRTAISTS